MRVEVNPDKTVRVEKHDRFQGLSAIFASALVEPVNQLDVFQLAAVLSSVRTCPFPLANSEAERVYRNALKFLQESEEADVVCFREKLVAADLGEFRRAVLERASQGCNAPHDHYLKVADQVRRGVAVDLYGGWG